LGARDEPGPAPGRREGPHGARSCSTPTSCSTRTTVSSSRVKTQSA
jgi:hypothetical protein